MSDESGRVIPHGEALGRLEGALGEDLAVAEAYCTPTPPLPDNLSRSDWEELITAVQAYMGSEATECVECGADLTDPKNRGDPDVNGDWVCSNPVCRAAHSAEMTCDIVVER